MGAFMNTVKRTLHLNTYPARRALSIAIRYTDLAVKHPWAQLKSTHEDVNHVKRLLSTLGYQMESKDVRILKDEELEGASPQAHADTYPNRENIIKAMKWLVAGARPGDHFVFHFSGHGSQQLATKDEKERDHMDEVVWPADVVLDTDNMPKENMIIDDEIRTILVDSLPRGAHLVMLFDCCHSGTVADLDHVHSDHMMTMTQVANFAVHRNAIEHDQDNGDTLVSPLSPLSAAASAK
ncbi:hypothetical protein PHLGIDRAFT_369970 [Phlebiopsis gigantea 11061_1 CR5-6]|uniref:Peptidase C14 caspase domain-containing protein n=1 Tax=Phlebiopsis gigantea (strain 11061_1 CR5-6) TaxID=745531 RepID=A0A0C3PW19_PHLG1|nr:hypothetical protein PHLGIDRAFT_369970 [Phlebiopsis gigantea 11061_1 CR5-6]